MRMFKDMTLGQRLGLTPEGVAELKEATCKELAELGFTNLPKANADDTHNEIYEQIDNDTDLEDKVFDVVCDYYADVGVYKENYEERLNQWIAEQTDRLHGE